MALKGRDHRAGFRRIDHGGGAAVGFVQQIDVVVAKRGQQFDRQGRHVPISQSVKGESVIEGSGAEQGRADSRGFPQAQPLPN